MLQRVVTGITMRISDQREGVQLDVTVRCTESSLGGGKVVFEHDRYEALTPAELADIIDQVLECRHIGSSEIPEEEQHRLFILS